MQFQPFEKCSRDCAPGPPGWLQPKSWNELSGSFSRFRESKKRNLQKKCEFMFLIFIDSAVYGYIYE